MDREIKIRSTKKSMTEHNGVLPFPSASLPHCSHPENSEYLPWIGMSLRTQNSHIFKQHSFAIISSKFMMKRIKQFLFL